MKILYLSGHPTHDTKSSVGYSTHQKEMIEAFESLGHEVFPVIIGNVRLNQNTSSAPQKIKPKGAAIKKLIPKVIWQGAKDLQMIKHDKQVVYPKFKEAFETFKPDFVYERSEMLIKSGVNLANHYEIPHCFEVNGPAIEEMKSLEGASILERKAHRIEKLKFQKSDAILTVSSAMDSFLQSQYSVEKAKISILPNAVNQSFLLPSQKNSNTIDFKTKLGIKGNEFILGFVGSVLPFHGVDLLVKAALELEVHEPIKLLIVGDGRGIEELKSLCDQHVNGARILFIGHVPHKEVAKYIQLFDIALMAKSNWYGSPVKIFEYGALKKAIIAPDVIPVKDVMTHDKHGLLVQPTISNLKQAIVQLMKDENLRKNLALEFHQKVTTEHLWTKNAEKVVEIMNSKTTHKL